MKIGVSWMAFSYLQDFEYVSTALSFLKTNLSQIQAIMGSWLWFAQASQNYFKTLNHWSSIIQW